MTVHLIKMAVGAEDVRHLADIQSTRLRQARERGDPPVLRHFTRHTPRRSQDLLDGGSIYWVIKGLIRVRQALVGIERGVNAEGRPSCALVMDPELIRIQLRASRPFQGWRYLRADAAPPDANRPGDVVDDVPEAMAAELRDLGLL